MARRDNEALVDAATLHLWDEGIIRPEEVGREAVLAIFDYLDEHECLNAREEESRG